MTIKQEKATQVDPGGHSFVINERLKYVYQKRARFCLGNLDVREKQSAAWDERDQDDRGLKVIDTNRRKLSPRALYWTGIPQLSPVAI